MSACSSATSGGLSADSMKCLNSNCSHSVWLTPKDRRTSAIFGGIDLSSIEEYIAECPQLKQLYPTVCWSNLNPARLPFPPWSLQTLHNTEKNPLPLGVRFKDTCWRISSSKLLADIYRKKKRRRLEILISSLWIGL